MSKQIGLIKVNGNLDGVSFYQSDGENFVRMAKGPSKKRIQTDPAFQRTRENNREFAGCALVAKSFRNALTPVTNIADRHLNSRTITVLKTVNVQGAGIRGQRNFEISKFKDFLMSLELNVKQQPFEKVFKLHKGITTEHSADRDAATLTIPGFSTYTDIVPAQGVTHMRFVHVLGVISDFNYSVITKGYVPLEPKTNGISTATYSDYIPLNTGKVPEIKLASVLPGTPVIAAKSSVIQGVGVIYYQEAIDGTLYPMKQDNVFRIVEVF